MEGEPTMEKNLSSVELFYNILYHVGEIIRNTTFDSAYPTVLKNNISVKIDETIACLEKENEFSCIIENECLNNVDKLMAVLDILKDGYIGGNSDERGKDLWKSEI